jgi:hypothetical protein
VALLVAAGPATSALEANPQPVPAFRAYVDHANLLKWLSDGERGLWVQATDLRWFYGALAGACHGLNATTSILFDTGPSSRIDRESSVIVPGGQRCRFRSFLPSHGPPRDRYKQVAEQPQAQ